MFNKVLIADDLGSINDGVLGLLQKLGINDIVQVQYCDEAYLKIKEGLLKKAPFDLLISDLSFVADYRKQTFTSGDALATAIKKEHPELKVIIYSVEDRFQRIRHLYNEIRVDAYVGKGRTGLSDLQKAVQDVFIDKRFISPAISQALSPTQDLEITTYDIRLLKLLSLGHSHQSMSTQLEALNITPSGVSSIEKRINGLKMQFGAQNRVHLISLVKDLGLI
ncbi:DNA-binding response regulator [Dokdonia sinensis]|uniref:DNA-binding response regulator n=1 Tax=Dokdonia sinensis TaxID=2479847 RepID=A0A3M0G2H3_9FLAO|nr:DUF5932 domain-containing protein [Dokdonia sinensis]RMB59150.1 DNA-binding response regulator [Dokdonia sinensis]